MRPVPASLPIFAIEPVRERVVPGPLMLVTEPLANFALTRHSWRSESADENLQIRVLLAQTFLAHADLSSAFSRQIWLSNRGHRGHRQRALVVAAALSGRLAGMLRGAPISDLASVVAWALLHPVRFARLFRSPARFPEVFTFLDRAASTDRQGRDR